MKKLIWGCTQMIVGMLGVIASLIFFVFGAWGWLSDALQVISFILLFLCAFVVFGDTSTVFARHSRTIRLPNNFLATNLRNKD